MNNKRKLVIAGIGAAVLLIIVIIGASRGKGNAVTAQTETIGYTNFVNKLPENGVVQRPTVQTIAALVPGNLGAVFVRPGQRVANGQLLATIVNPQITSGAVGAGAAYRAAVASAQSAAANGQTSIVQAEAQLQAARANLTQAQQDLTNGSQSGLGYGGSTATDQKVAANATLANAQTTLNEAQRIYNADLDLFNNKAISRNQLDQDKAKLDQAQVSYNQAVQQRRSLDGQLSRSQQVLQDRYKSSQEGLLQAQAALSAAREQESGGSTTAAYAQAQKAQIDYQYADTQAASTQLRAPFDGVIQSMAAQPNDPLRPLQPGDTISTGQGIFTLARTDAFVVRALVDEQDVINVRVGQAATITGQDFPGKIGGHVSFVSPVAQKSTDPSSTARQVLTTIRLDTSPDYLKDGLSVDVDILTKNVPHSISVPTGAIINEKAKKYLYVVRGGIAKKTAVVTGQASDTQTLIKSGLAPKDIIVTESNPLIQDGTRINPVTRTQKLSPA